MSTTVDIATIEIADAHAVFTTAANEKPLQPYLDQVRAVLDDFTADATTDKGRDEIRSMAHKVGKVKAAIEREGKAVADKVKALPKIVDANRKHAADTLTDWQAEVRAPLTAWEEKEEARKAAHVNRLADIETLRSGINGMSLARLKEIKEKLERMVATIGDREEFADQYEQLILGVRHSFSETIEIATKQAAEAEELARLRADKARRDAEDAERERKENEARIAAEAAQRAQAQAEARAAAEREAADRRVREAEERAERAARDERERIEREQKAARDAEEARQRDEKHREKIIVEARDNLVDFVGLSPFDAQTVVDAIAEGRIPHVSFKF